MEKKGFGNNDEQEKARKLSPAEERRLERFEVTSEKMAEEGFRRTDLTVSIMEANKFGLLLLIPLFLIGGGLFYLRHGWGMWGGIFTPFLRFMAYMVAFVVLHEAIHGLSWSLFCPNGFKDVQFGIMKQYLTPYCTCLVPLSKGAYIFGALMPLVILGIVPMIAGIVTGDWSVELMGIIMADSAAGDIMIVRDILRYRSTREEVVYIDHPTQAGGVIFER